MLTVWQTFKEVEPWARQCPFPDGVSHLVMETDLKQLNTKTWLWVALCAWRKQIEQLDSEGYLSTLHILSSLFLFFFCSNGVWTQGHTPPALFLWWDRFSWTICLAGFEPQSSWVARITGVSHQYLDFTSLFCSTGVWTQGLMLGMPALYHLRHSTNPVLC
jgi:hypothetical protein